MAYAHTSSALLASSNRSRRTLTDVFVNRWSGVRISRGLRRPVPDVREFSSDFQATATSLEQGTVAVQMPAPILYSNPGEPWRTSAALSGFWDRRSIFRRILTDLSGRLTLPVNRKVAGSSPASGATVFEYDFGRGEAAGGRSRGSYGHENGHGIRARPRMGSGIQPHARSRYDQSSVTEGSPCT